jgi:Lrp/AsnC family leucine-responsive transcriptional regulator|tara:strand:+ start:92 stop:562 length:471 start_codon:yes stop_codon:yes gene_type:complete
MNIDKADIAIINALQKNARIGIENLAELASLSPASVQRRLKTLRESGIILREVAVVDPSKVGQLMSFVVLVELERERRDQIDQFIRRVLKEPQVQQCYYVTGDADFCLICTAQDMDDFEMLTQRLFFEDANVRRFRTSVVMGRKKVSMEIHLKEHE